MEAASGLFTYPRNVHVDFTKLDREALFKVIKFYGGAVPPNTTSNLDLACLAARYFASHTPIDRDIVDTFATQFCHSGTDAPRRSKRPPKSTEPLRVGEQAAARVSNSDENGTWILVNVLYYDAASEKYEVQDEDDASRVMRLDAADVRKLGEAVSLLHRGDRVLAVFPETTSFYRGAVAKNPKGANSDVLLRFDDDEDEAGRPLIRRVPARFVLYDEEGEQPMDNDY